MFFLHFWPHYITFVFQDSRKDAHIKNKICKIFYLDTVFGEKIPLRFCQRLAKTCQKPTFLMGEQFSMALDVICENLEEANSLQIDAPTEVSELNIVRM